MNHSMNRRSALAVLVSVLSGFWTASAAVISGLFMSTPLRRGNQKEAILLGDRFILEENFRAVRLRVPLEDGWHSSMGDAIVYARVNENGDPVILSGTCTHLGCTVNWHVAEGEFRCPCHDGRYDREGNVLSGPPPGPLAPVPYEVSENGKIYVRLS